MTLISNFPLLEVGFFTSSGVAEASRATTVSEPTVGSAVTGAVSAESIAGV